MKKVTTNYQYEIPLRIEKEVEINGIGMGVLNNGTPYLTTRGLAKLCGVDHAVIVRLADEWGDTVQKPRVTKIKSILSGKGVDISSPFVEVEQAKYWTAVVCLSVLEYYSFEAKQGDNTTAVQNYRALAGQGFENFIYTQVGYDPDANVPAEWQQFHDRVSITYNALPAGYFGIFKEIADLIVTLGQSGLHIDSSFVPDISVGLCWATHWNDNDFDNKYDKRIRYEHNYPDYFPQAKSNPQEPWCYPESALGEFRAWFRNVYVGDGKLKKYLQNQAKVNALPASFAQLAISVLENKTT